MKNKLFPLGIIVLAMALWAFGTNTFRNASRETNNSLPSATTASQWQVADLTKDAFMADNGIMGLDKALEACMSQSNSTKEKEGCITAISKKWEMELNNYYAKRINNGTGEFEEFSDIDAITALKKAQKAWLYFKEQELLLTKTHIFKKPNPHTELELNKIRTLQLASVYMGEDEMALQLAQYARAQIEQYYGNKGLLEDCSTKSNLGQRSCFIETTEQYDSQLNMDYKKMRGLLNVAGKEQLKKTQLAWINFKDAELDIWNTIESKFTGSMYINRTLLAKARIIRQRAVELERYKMALTP